MTLPDDLFTGGGDTGRLMAGLDWSASGLGTIDRWPQSLKAAVRIVLSSRYPMLLLWGPDFTQLYNDAYSALIGDKHPAALGLDVRITLAEGWDVLRPLIDEAMATGVASWVPALQLLLERSGYREEAYFSVSHAPARDDDGVTRGVLTVCSEVTDQIVGERRLRLLRDLALPISAAGQADVEQTCLQLCEVIGGHRLDVPFAAVYLRSGGRLLRYASVGADDALLPDEVALDADETSTWRLAEAVAGAVVEVHQLDQRLTIEGGPWGDPVRTAIVQPLPSSERTEPVGVLLTGVSPSRALDETYRSFLQVLAQQVAVAVRNAQAFQEERDRAAVLAELDRVKTDFFTNVSHEFRTPLTLMLGPLADALADQEQPLRGTQHERVDTAWRNANRLLALVNELLTFSSIGAVTRDTPPPLDLAELTRDVAGVFRAGVERTGLRLVVDCPPLPGLVAVDAAHWERIVTNLLSNALKFTFVGAIRVTLTSDDTAIRLRVADTGIGIDPVELPRLFDRFHRVRGARSRSHEGTGIGLALVRELARLAGGDVEASSLPGQGTTFTVVLPWAAVRSTSMDVTPSPVHELVTARAVALQAADWTGEAPSVPPGQVTAHRASILVADDNSDMRAYLARLLTDQGWMVETAADGVAALQAIRRHQPQLLITDVMMPRLDGFALVRALRADESTRGLPILMLSARAGQESGVEGLSAGADDYIVKPFSAAELIARVRNTLALARTRATSAHPAALTIEPTAVITGGRMLEDALRTATDLARVLLDGAWATTVLADPTGQPSLTFSAPGADETPVIRNGSEVHAQICGRGGGRIGLLTIGFGPGQATGEKSQVAAMTDVLAGLAGNAWHPYSEQQLALAPHQQPTDLPQAEGWDVHVAYRAATADDTGRGWHDIIDFGDGTLLLGIGDVAGPSLRAAVTAGQLRAALRAVLAGERGPGRILDRASALLQRLTNPVSASLLLVHFTVDSGRIKWASAGHPNPVYTVAGSAARFLNAPAGPLLGADAAPYSQHEEVLAPGSRLLLFSRGLLTNGSDDSVNAQQRLLQRCDKQSAAIGSMDALVEALLADAGAQQHDDVALIAVGRHTLMDGTAVAVLPQMDRSWTYPLHASAAASARRDLAAAFNGTAIDPDLLYDLQIAVTEAINNAVEHAQQPSRPEIDLRLRVTDGMLCAQIQDFGGWRARPPARDRGRGAILMNAYGDVRVTTNPLGTLVTIERRGAVGPVEP